MDAATQEAARAHAEEVLVARLMAQIKLSPEALQQITLAAHEGIASGLKDGFSQIATPENARLFWGAAFTAFREGADKKTGQIVLGAARKAIAKGWMYMLLACMLYAAGGWPLLVSLWRAAIAKAGAGGQ